MSNELTTTEAPKALEKNVINYEPIFPILTARVLLDLAIEEMAEDALGLVNNGQNCPGGYSSLLTNQSIDSIRGVKELKEAIYGISCAFARELKFEATYDKSNINVWLEVMRRDSLHDTRYHPRSVFAGQFMVRTEKDYSPIVLTNPTMGLRTHEPFVRAQDFGPFTAEAIVINPEVNTLTIWPSWMQYKMPVMTEPGPRISFGFSIDFLPPGV